MPLHILSATLYTCRAGEAVRNIAVDNLCKSDVSVVTVKIEACCFHVCHVGGHPFHILSFQEAIRCGFCLFGHRLNVRCAIDWLLGAGHVGQPLSLRHVG